MDSEKILQEIFYKLANELNCIIDDAFSTKTYEQEETYLSTINTISEILKRVGDTQIVGVSQEKEQQEETIEDDRQDEEIEKEVDE